MEIVIFQLVILLFSAVIHEVSHGFVADYLGDPTAREAGRLTLNPLRHLEPFGSVILPLSLFFVSGGSFIFGWAKPVPYNPYNLKKPDRDGGLIAAAGPISNFLIAVVFGIIYRLLGSFNDSGVFSSALELFSVIVLINLMLMIFNLAPLPPLDGSKVLFALLPRGASEIRGFLEQYGLILLLFFMFFGFRLIIPIVFGIYKLILGL